MRLYSFSDIQKAIPGASLDRGYRYYRQGRVQGLRFRNGGGLLTAQVRGSKRRPYEQHIQVLVEGGRARIQGSCTCPMAFNCKHVAAVLLAGMASPEGRELARPHGLEPALALWLEELGKAFAPAPTNRFLRPIDLDILRRLCQDGQAGLVGDGYRLQGEAGRALLETMLATGRCHWLEVGGPALAPGPARRAEASWGAADDGTQKLDFAVEGGAAAILPLAPPHYVDAAAGLVGPIESGLPDRVAAALALAPTIPPGQVETVRDEVARRRRVRREIAKKGVARSHIVILDALLKLRQVCCDPRLVKLEAARRITQSAKLERLLDMLPEMIEEGRRVLLFSQFTSMLALIEPELKKHRLDYLKLTGQTRDRAALVERFQAGEAPVFLISLKAGGSGLNLTAADTVIHYDPWWNPAVEDQASDRAHRIGQDKAVFVYKLRTLGTVEEKILALQASKRELALGLLTPGAEGAAAIGEEALAALFAPLGA